MKRLLIVDDEPNVLSAVSRCFLDTPYDVFTALSGHAGLQLLQQHGGAELIISDYRMPGMNGVEFLQQAVRQWPDSKRILLSAYPDTDILLTALNQGLAHRFITKPWDNQQLTCVVNELLNEIDILTSVRQEVEELVKRNQILASTNDQLQALLNDLLKAVRSENAVTPAADNTRQLQMLNILSDRERQILQRLASGQRPKEIAQDLGISIKTVSTYKFRLFEKMGFSSEAALITFAIKHTLLPAP